MQQQLKIGLIGGGQLGAMTIAAAIKMGVDVAILDTGTHVPAGRFTAGLYCGDALAYDDVASFGKDKTIVSYEKEAVNIEALKWLRTNGVKVYPTPETLEMIQDKWLQKQFLASNNIPTAKGQYIANIDELKNAAIGYPACLKLCRNGYDGRGVMILKSTQDIAGAFNAPCLLETCIEIDKEISVLVARNPQGDVKCYDPVQMSFNDETHILEYQQCPANISASQHDEACRLAVRIAELTGLVGIMAVEMFIDKKGAILVNELAPRAHNSGHHTIEAAATSQFEQHLRAILNLPLGATTTLYPSIMLNIISNSKLAANQTATIKALMAIDGVHVHWYGKPIDKPGRKVGHITITGGSMEVITKKAQIVKELIK